jgi:hypothetical protein
LAFLADAKTLTLLLLLSAAAYAQNCAQETVHFYGASGAAIRIDENHVKTYGQSWATGDVDLAYTPYEEAWLQLNGNDYTSGYTSNNSPGQVAQSNWTATLNIVGPGAYRDYSYHWFVPSCSGWSTNQLGYTSGTSLTISLPTISGVAGIWYLGTASVNDNCSPTSACYYNATILTVNTDPGGIAPTSSSPATWSLTFPTGMSAFANYACQNSACSQVKVTATSYPSACSPITVTSTLAGFQSSSLSLYVEYPQTTQLGSVQDNGLPGPPPGYLSANTLKLISKCGNTMFEMDVHEQFPANPSACGGSANWTDPVPQSQWGSWTTDNNGQFTDTVGYACSGCSPLSTIPGPLQTPPKALSTQANAYASQFIYVGSLDIQNLGKYFTAAPNMQVRYTDHGRDQPGTWKCQ